MLSQKFRNVVSKNAEVYAKSKIFNWLKNTEKGISKKRLQKVQNPENSFVGKKFLGSY
jgi:hypothetical protein